MFGKKENQKADLEIFVFHDSKAQAYGQPSFAVNRHDLVRQIMNMFREPEQQAKNTLFVNAEDFSVFKIGSYDKATGKITVEEREHVANLIDLRAAVAPSWPNQVSLVGSAHPDMNIDSFHPARNQ